MTLVPFSECCLRLGIDPKTLRLWLKAANLSCCLHPLDARLKCLTSAQLQQVADMHARPLLSVAPLPMAALSQAPAAPISPATVIASSLPSPHADDAALGHQLLLVQAQVLTLQAQVTDLALLLLRGGFSQSQLPTSSPAPPPPVSAIHFTPALATSTAAQSSETKASAAPAPEPPRARSRALPLIQVRADGRVVVIAPTEGVLALLPDSAAWFAWLASLTAFTFECPQGRFSATRKFRDGQRIQAWNVHRSLHGRSCTLYLGLTSTLTLARLHQMAHLVLARLSAH